MATVEERVAHLEGQMQEQSQGFPELRASIARLDSMMSDSIAHLDARVSDSIARLDDKMSRHFIWLVGILVTVLAAVVGGLLSR